MTTVRELQIAELIAWGQTEKDIARNLYLSTDTVKTHKKNLMRKIGAHNIADVTRWFITKTENIRLTKSEFARQTISVFLLLLTLGDIAGHQEVYRVFRTKTRTETRARRRKDEY